MNEKQCTSCKHALNMSKNGPCRNCENFSNWIKITIQPSTTDTSVNWIQPCVYEALVRMYDRYAEVVLTAPIKEDSPDIMNMDQFFNHVLVRGLMSYGEFLMPMEKELGII